MHEALGSTPSTSPLPPKKTTNMKKTFSKYTTNNRLILMTTGSLKYRGVIVMLVIAIL
jgi:hypothetical protein